MCESTSFGLLSWRAPSPTGARLPEFNSKGLGSCRVSLAFHHCFARRRTRSPSGNDSALSSLGRGEGLADGASMETPVFVDGSYQDSGTSFGPCLHSSTRFTWSRPSHTEGAAWSRTIN